LKCGVLIIIMLRRLTQHHTAPTTNDGRYASSLPQALSMLLRRVFSNLTLVQHTHKPQRLLQGCPNPPTSSLPQALSLQLSALESLPDGIHGVIAALLSDEHNRLFVSASSHTLRRLYMHTLAKLQLRSQHTRNAVGARRLSRARSPEPQLQPPYRQRRCIGPSGWYQECYANELNKKSGPCKCRNG
jgi:hypothetical protein